MDGLRFITVWTHFDFTDDPILGTEDLLCHGTNAAGDLTSMPGGNCLWSKYISYLGVGPSTGNANLGVIEKSPAKGGSPPGAFAFPNLAFFSRPLLPDGSDFYPDMYGGGQGVWLVEVATVVPVGLPPAGFVRLYVDPVTSKLTIMRSDGSTATL